MSSYPRQPPSQLSNPAFNHPLEPAFHQQIPSGHSGMPGPPSVPPGLSPAPATAPPPLLPQGPPQLPPQMFTTASQLLDLTDKKLVLVLRDGRKLIGVLRSWDQFANLLMQDTIERIYAGGFYADRREGVFIVRGENVMLLGEVDLDREDDIAAPFQPAPWDQVVRMKEQENEIRKQVDGRRSWRLRALGFEPEHSGEVLF